MIPMFQTFQIKAISASVSADATLSAETANEPHFALTNTPAEPEQSDDPSSTILQGMVPLNLMPALQPLPTEALPDGAAWPAEYDLPRAAIPSAKAGGVETPVAELAPHDKAPDKSEALSTALAHRSAPADEPAVNPGSPQPALAVPGAVETAVRIRWADHSTKEDAKSAMVRSGQQAVDQAEMRLTVAVKPSVQLPQPSSVLSVFPLLAEADQDFQVEPVGEGFGLTNLQSNSAFTISAPTGQNTSLPAIKIAHLPLRLVAQAATGNDSQADLALNPEELGRLRFAIQHQDGKLTVVLTAERPDTLALLRQNAPQLLAEFVAAGFSGTTLSFGKWGGGENRNTHPPESAELASVQTDALAPPPREGPVRGLDLRL